MKRSPFNRAIAVIGVCWTVGVLGIMAQEVRVGPATQAVESVDKVPPAGAAVKVEPKLTEAQVLQVQNVAQRIELAQQRARASALEQQVAQIEFEKAREAASKLVQALQVPGYDLDLDRFVYTPTKAKPSDSKSDPPQP